MLWCDDLKPFLLFGWCVFYHFLPFFYFLDLTTNHPNQSSSSTAHVRRYGKVCKTEFQAVEHPVETSEGTEPWYGNLPDKSWTKSMVFFSCHFFSGILCVFTILFSNWFFFSISTSHVLEFLPTSHEEIPVWEVKPMFAATCLVHVILFASAKSKV